MIVWLAQSYILKESESQRILSLIFILWQQASVNLRKAVLQFFAQLDTIELPLFFALLLKPLNIIPREADASANWFCNLHLVSMNASATNILKYFSTESIVALSWKKKYGFMHVIEEVLAVFDEMLISPFLNIILGCVVRILASCTSSLHVARQNEAFLYENGKTHDRNSLEMNKEAASPGLVMLPFRLGVSLISTFFI